MNGVLKNTKNPKKKHKTKTKRMITNINTCRQNSVWPCFFLSHAL